MLEIVPQHQLISGHFSNVFFGLFFWNSLRLQLQLEHLQPWPSLTVSKPA
jgi:hypothetical protein